MQSARRMVKKTVQRGRSKRRGEAYFLRYAEPLSAARTKLADFFNILLVHVKAGIEKVRKPLAGGRCLRGILEDVLEVDRTT